jgi:hypothetical protein
LLVYTSHTTSSETMMLHPRPFTEDMRLLGLPGLPGSRAVDEVDRTPTPLACEGPTGEIGALGNV